MKGKNNPALVIESVCVYNLASYMLLLSSIITPNTYEDKVRFCVIQMFFLGEQRKATEMLASFLGVTGGI